jgi:LPS O-antigen subunit length determinant protein (WzzB/FepE family)
MAQNKIEKSFNEKEIDFGETINKLLESKKLIISTILFFSITSSIYIFSLKPSFKSLAKFEIGHITMPNGEIKLIETAKDLTSHLNILLLKNPDNKYNQTVSIKSFEDKVISLETISDSPKKNEEVINNIMNHIKKHHNNILTLAKNEKKETLTFSLDKVKSEIAYIESKLSKQNQSDILNFIKDLTPDQTASFFIQIHYETIKNSDRLFSLNRQLSILNRDIELFENRDESITQSIQDIQTNTIKPNYKVAMSLAIIIGFITGSALVLFKDSIKRYRENGE